MSRSTGRSPTRRRQGRYRKKTSDAGGWDDVGRIRAQGSNEPKLPCGVVHPSLYTEEWLLILSSSEAKGKTEI